MVLHLAGHVSKGVVEVGKVFVCQQSVHFKSFNIKNPIFSSKIPVPVGCARKQPSAKVGVARCTLLWCDLALRSLAEVGKAHVRPKFSY